MGRDEQEFGLEADELLFGGERALRAAEVNAVLLKQPKNRVNWGAGWDDSILWKALDAGWRGSSSEALTSHSFPSTVVQLEVTIPGQWDSSVASEVEMLTYNNAFWAWWWRMAGDHQAECALDAKGHRPTQSLNVSVFLGGHTQSKE